MCADWAVAARGARARLRARCGWREPFPMAASARRMIEAMFCRLKDFRRVATRYDKLAANFASAVALAAVLVFWC